MRAAAKSLLTLQKGYSFLIHKPIRAHGRQENVVSIFVAGRDWVDLFFAIARTQRGR
jgi:hypothetical protein